MKIICYGDSNTYGYDGDTVIGGRFPETERWPELLGQMLGCEVFNCGLNGRRVPRFQRSLEADLAQLRRRGQKALLPPGPAALGQQQEEQQHQPQREAEEQHDALVASFRHGSQNRK